MNLEKLNPWNWFKHEEDDKGQSIPVSRSNTATLPADIGSAGSLLRLHRDMDRWFNDALSSFGMPSVNRGLLSSGMPEPSGFFRPQIDVSADDDCYEIALDVPGMSESDINIEVRGDMLLIKGQKEDRRENREKHFYRVERSFGSFQRTLALPEDANADEIKADLKEGVLKLEIPRRAIASDKVKQIPISS